MTAAIRLPTVPATRARLRPVATTCALALGALFLLEHRPLLDPAGWTIGRNPSDDVQIMTWSLTWWPWAVLHGIDPLRTSLLWAPHGFPTLWMTSIPAVAAALAPVTLTLGPLVAYNVAMVLAVVAAAASMYLLCEEITGDSAASTAGALAFALSPYLLGHVLSQHLNLVVVFPLPLLARLAIRRARGTIGRRRYCASSALLLLVIAGCSLELLADLTFLVAVVAALTVLLGRRVGSPGARFWGEAAAAYACALPVLVPLALAALASAHGNPSAAPADYSTDAANLLVPTPTTLIGAFGSLPRLSAHFVGNIGERDGYLGLPLLLVAAAVLRRPAHRGLRIAGIVLAAAVVLSLGPVVSVAGRPLLSLPISTATLPVLRDALPARLALFADAAVACLLAAWVARARRSRLRLLAVAVVAASLVPNIQPAARVPSAWAVSNGFAWASKAPTQLASTRAWRRIVTPGARVLVVPTLDRAPAEYWQATSGMAFDLLAPETPFVPTAVAGSPVMAKLVADALPQLDGRRLAAARLGRLLAVTGTRTVVVTRAERRLWQPVVAAATGTAPVRADGALLYPVRRGLRPLVADGEIASRGRAAAAVRVWIRFDGRRGAVRARTADGIATLSSSTGDADSPALASAGRRAAVAFTEWRGGHVLVRVARRAGRGWRTATLGRNAAAVWSVRVALGSPGRALAAWVDATPPQRELVIRERLTGGTWTRPSVLARAEAVRSLSIVLDRNGIAVAAWQEAAGPEWVACAAIGSSGHWRVETLGASASPFADVRLSRAGAAVVVWGRHRTVL